MKHFKQDPKGSARAVSDGQGGLRPNGWRKPTPGLLQAERFAEIGEGLSVPKTRAIVAAKKVAAAIGLKSQDLLLLDTFGALTQAQDWEQGRRPIVWASNNFLLEQTSFSLSTLRRHVRRLCEVGLIAMKDSPNGKRWGRRDQEGVIVEAYGFDLAPLAARAEEFEALYAHLQAERAHCASLRNAITVTRRVIRAKIDKALENGLRGPWRQLSEALRALLEALPGRSGAGEALEAALEQLRALQGSVEGAFEAGFDQTSADENDKLSKKMAPTSPKDETHIQTTNELHSVKSNCFEQKHAARVVSEEQGVEQVERPEEVDLDINWSTHGTKRRSDVDVSTLVASCPHFADMAHGTQGYMKDWSDVHRAAAALRPVVGISEDAWNVANKVMGPVRAAASIALILDKSSDGEVKSPGGYLRGLVEKAQAGELHLDRSLYGRLGGVRV